MLISLHPQIVLAQKNSEASHCVTIIFSRPTLDQEKHDSLKSEQKALQETINTGVVNQQKFKCFFNVFDQRTRLHKLLGVNQLKIQSLQPKKI